MKILKALCLSFNVVVKGILYHCLNRYNKVVLVKCKMRALSLSEQERRKASYTGPRLYTIYKASRQIHSPPNTLFLRPTGQKIQNYINMQYFFIEMP